MNESMIQLTDMAFYENLKAEGEISDDEDNIGNDEE